MASQNQNRIPPPPPMHNGPPPGAFPQQQQPGSQQPPQRFAQPGPPQRPPPQVQIVNGSTKIIDVTTLPSLTEEKCRELLSSYEAYTLRKLDDPSNLVPVKKEKEKKKSKNQREGLNLGLITLVPGKTRRHSRHRRHSHHSNDDDTRRGKWHLSWAKAQLEKESYATEHILQTCKRLDATDKRNGTTVTKKKTDLKPYQQTQITRLLDGKNGEEMDGNFVWTLRQFDRSIIRNEAIGKDETESLVAYVKRAPRPDIASAIQLYHTIQAHNQQLLKQQQFQVEQRILHENAMMHNQMLQQQQALRPPQQNGGQQNQRIGPPPNQGGGQKKNASQEVFIINENLNKKKNQKRGDMSRSRSRARSRSRSPSRRRSQSRGRNNKKKVLHRSRGRRSASSNSDRSSRSSRSRSSSRDSLESDSSSDVYSESTYSSYESRTGRRRVRTHEKEGFVVVERERRPHTYMPQVPRVTSFERLSPGPSPIQGRFAQPVSAGAAVVGAGDLNRSYIEGVRDALKLPMRTVPRAIGYHTGGGSSSTKSNSDGSVDLEERRNRIHLEEMRELQRMERERELRRAEERRYNRRDRLFSDGLPPDDFLMDPDRDRDPDHYDRPFGRARAYDRDFDDDIVHDRLRRAEERIRRDTEPYIPLRDPGFTRRRTFDPVPLDRDAAFSYVRSPNTNPFATRRRASDYDRYDKF